MAKHEGAWVEAVRWTIQQDFDAKNKIIEGWLANPETMPEGMSGQDIMAFYFGDLQAFIDKLGNT